MKQTVFVDEIFSTCVAVLLPHCEKGELGLVRSALTLSEKSRLYLLILFVHSVPLLGSSTFSTVFQAWIFPDIPYLRSLRG